MATSERPPSTGIKVIIVGAGFAGLTAAIECHRKGHEVLVLESFPELKILGDIISFAPNSGRIFQRWEGVDAKLDPIIHKSDGLRIKTWKGSDLTKQTWGEEGKKYGKAYNGHVRMFGIPYCFGIPVCSIPLESRNIVFCSKLLTVEVLTF